MQARVIYVDKARGVEEIAVGEHSIELSALGGSYCHNHASADCFDGLSAGELDALRDSQLLAVAA